MRLTDRKIAAALAAVTLVLSTAAPVKAAAPHVSVDETMYVNLDYYGNATAVNVVKGCSPNGNVQFTDYGVYDKVVNMTDQSEPQIGEGTVTWQLPEGNNRFYYQCTMPEGSVELPWKFDVSYRLNGVEADAAALAGASGLVELHIKAVPNPQARAYYRNNMLLMVMVPVDMGTNYSIEAPGSQLQTLGEKKVALFAALPGQEGDYTVRIGTDDFESTGVIMMMVPGTADALDDIKELKEAKDTWREDGDRLYDSMNQLLRSVEAMKPDISQIKDGLGNLEQARGQFSANRKQIEALTTQAVADLKSVADQTTVLIPYLETARNAVTDINTNINAISHTIEDTQDELDRLYDRLGSLRRSLDTLAKQMEGGISLQEKSTLSNDILTQTGEIEEILGELEQSLGSSSDLMNITKADLGSLKMSLEHSDSFRYSRTRDSDIRYASPSEASERSPSPNNEEDSSETEDDKRGPSGLPGSGGADDEDFESWSEEIDPHADELEEALQALSGTAYPGDIQEILAALEEAIGNGAKIRQTAEALVDKVNGICDSAGNASKGTANTLSSLRSVTDEIINLLDDSRVLIDTMDSYVPALLNSLSDTEELMNRLAKAMGSTHDMLSLVNQTAIAAGDSMDAGLRESLVGLQSTLDKSLGMLDSVAGVREAGEGMKRTLDEQLDKFEDENNFLNLDPEAKKMSFTSSKNQSPDSLQIVLRTDEISHESQTTDITDLEDSAGETAGPFRRMWNVIVQIFKAIAEIFRNR